MLLLGSNFYAWYNFMVLPKSLSGGGGKSLKVLESLMWKAPNIHLLALKCHF